MYIFLKVQMNAFVIKGIFLGDKVVVSFGEQGWRLHLHVVYTHSAYTHIKVVK